VNDETEGAIASLKLRLIKQMLDPFEWEARSLNHKVQPKILKRDPNDWLFCATLARSVVRMAAGCRVCVGLVIG
jgi:hypothetical protein